MRLNPEYLVQKYQENIFRTAMSVCKNPQDAEDATQNTFVQYLKSDREFESEEHIKAWLLRTAVNQSKNMVTAFWHRNKISWEEYMDSIPFEEPRDQALVEAVLSLPAGYRIVIHLYYYEDYSVAEISDILHISESAVRSRLMRGRRKLKEILKDDWEEEPEPSSPHGQMAAER